MGRALLVSVIVGIVGCGGTPPACPSGACGPLGGGDAGTLGNDAGWVMPGDDAGERSTVDGGAGGSDAGAPCGAIDETCNGIDDDCDGAIDEGVLVAFHRDADGDGFGDAGLELEACAPPSGFVLDATDCDDACPGCHPGASEICDELDQDCDGDAIEDELRTTFYVDADGDGFSSGIEGSVRLCAPATGWTDRLPTPDATDCADGDPRAFPGQTAYATSPVAGETGTIERWDFDCDGAASGEHGIGGSCDTSSFACSGRSGAFVGTTRPGCGESALFQDACGRVLEGGVFVCRSTTSTRAQACR